MHVLVEDSDGEQSTAKMSADVAKPGRLKATYMVKRAGEASITVQLVEPDGNMLQQRTFSLRCIPGKPSPAHFELQWPQKPLIAGRVESMEVVCKDAYNNLLTTLPGWELWSVFLQQVCCAICVLPLAAVNNWCGLHSFRSGCMPNGVYSGRGRMLAST